MSSKDKKERACRKRSEDEKVLDVRLPGYMGKGPFIWF